jgi:hypothetical protein
MIALVLAGTGCSGLQPVRTPADTQALIEEIARRGGTVRHVISGDRGCEDVGLIPNAVSLELTAGAPGDAASPEPEAALVYLFVFRDLRAFEDARGALEACRSAVDPGADAVSVAPYYAFGPELDPAQRRLLVEAFQAFPGR